MRRLPAFLMATAAAVITLLVTPSTLSGHPPLRGGSSGSRSTVRMGTPAFEFFLDGKGWESCAVSDPDGHLLVTVTATGSAGTNGLTEPLHRER